MDTRTDDDQGHETRDCITADEVGKRHRRRDGDENFDDTRRAGHSVLAIVVCEVSTESRTHILSSAGRQRVEAKQQTSYLGRLS